MPDLIAISQGLNAVKAATEILKTMVGLRDSVKLLENTVKLNGEILSVQAALAEAQQEQATLTKTIGDLEKEIARLKTWDAEKANYQLEKISSTGAVAYMLKPDARGSQPPHWLCTKCYEDEKRSIMQFVSDVGRDLFYKCPGCSGSITTHGERPEWLPKPPPSPPGRTVIARG